MNSAAPRKMGLLTATGLVVASMVGVGVFTTTGYLVKYLPSPGAILLCWLVAGLASLCGALAYAELGAAMPASGGEYHYLSRLIHPAAGFASAWASLVVGFSVPLAALALAFGSYLGAVFPGAPVRYAGGVLLVALSLLHMWRVSAGTRFQDAFTIAKVVFILAFTALGWQAGDVTLLSPDSAQPIGDLSLSRGFAVALMEVSFAYTGWNAAAYVAGEIRSPARNLPRALMFGTAVVTALYVMVNAVMLAASPLDNLAERTDVANVAAGALFGANGARAISALVAFGIVSTMGAMLVTGPRIYEAVGRDIKALSFLELRSRRSGPIVAISIQAGIALVMMFIAGFETLLLYVGFTLSLFAALTVGSVFILRRRNIDSPNRMPRYPVTPHQFVAQMAWIVFEGLRSQPSSALAGIATIAVGLAVYAVSQRNAALHRRNGPR